MNIVGMLSFIILPASPVIEFAHCTEAALSRGLSSRDTLVARLARRNFALDGLEDRNLNVAIVQAQCTIVQVGEGRSLQRPTNRVGLTAARRLLPEAG